MRHRLSERTGHLIEETWNNPPGAPVILFSPIYNGLKNMTTAVSDQEWKKGSAELLVLSLLEDQPRHGYDISKLIEDKTAK